MEPEAKIKRLGEHNLTETTKAVWKSLHARPEHTSADMITEFRNFTSCAKVLNSSVSPWHEIAYTSRGVE